MQLFRRHAWKALCQIEPHLVTEQADGASAGSVFLTAAFVQDILQKLQVSSHDWELAFFGCES